MEKPELEESIWRRGWDDTWRAIHSRLFWAIEVFGGGLIALADPILALIFIAGIAIAVWVGATAAAPIRQRNEARKVLAAQNNTQKNLICTPEVLRQNNGPNSHMYLKVKNPFNHTVNNVTVRASDIVPDELSTELRNICSQMNGEPFQTTAYVSDVGPDEWEIDIHPGQEAVFSIIYAGTDGKSVFVLARHIKRTGAMGEFYEHKMNRIEPGSCAFELVVSARDLAPQTLKFRVNISADTTSIEALNGTG